MSFGGGFGGFGSNNNQSSGFGSGGGFGSNTTGGFGSTPNTGSAFGQSNTGGGLFGGGSTSAFGGGGAFGSNNTSLASKPFGSGTGTTGLFGGGSTTGSGFGGFGGGSTTTPAAGGFGSSTGGGLFGGGAKPAFGSTGTGPGTGGAFGGGGTTSAFGSGTTGGFGSTSGFGAGSSTAPPPNNGTASVPFNAFQEKDGTGQQHFQTITFQDPYKNYSLEELRLVDYNQGRRYGNSNGQAGAFGQSTGFGGFGGSTSTPTPAFGGGSTNTGGGLFGGGNTSTTTPFGQSGTSAFGSNTATSGGGMFGAKPATSGLFGGGSSQPATGGGLFGSSTTNTGGGFGTGGSGFGSSTTGTGGLFGNQNQNQTQNKPAFGGFGASTTTAQPAANPFGGGNTSGGFGSTANTGGSLFGGGNQANSTPFGGGQQQSTATGGGLFGGGAAGTTGSTGGGLFGNTQTQTQTPASGGLFGGGQQNQTQSGGLFGAKPAAAGGLFGNTAQNTGTTGTSLFGGGSTTTQPSGGLFGGAQQNQAQPSGGLFGSKPATGGGLFGGGATQNTGTTGGGLFGNTNTANQANTGSSLFGGQKPGGLFGNTTTNANTGTSLFGGGQSQNNQPALGGSLFGNQSQQQAQQPSMNNSLFNASGNSAGASLLQTSMNTNPYGNDALFAGLGTPQQSPGPLATPLSSSQKNRKSAILPQHKLNPSASTRLLTPQNKRVGGYGFTYSTYGTPNSASASTSPNFSSSLFGNNSLTKSFGKSVSTSNLRNAYTPETSILAPGAFATTGRSFATGSLKKLNINRAINTRAPLFDEASPEKKRVSFAQPNDDDTAQTNGTGESAHGKEIVLRKEVEETTPEPEPSPPKDIAAVNGKAKEPEMTQVNGDLGRGGPLQPTTGSSLNRQGDVIVDPTPGNYYSIPSMDALTKMSRNELSHIENFVVGRDKIGEIQFNPGHPVDLSDVDLSKLFGDIVQLKIRNATVYGENTTVPKPARGSGLNVPSRITLGNSWPRNRAGKKDQKHLERLKRVHGTTFENYRAQTGEWIFTVPHFSSYGLDYEGDYYDDEGSELSDAPDTPAMYRPNGTPQDEDSASPTQSSPDDTFDFKNRSRNRAIVPGGYGNDVVYEEEVADEDMGSEDDQSFLGERSVGSLDGQHETDYIEESGSESAEDQDMAGPVSGPVHTTEQRTAPTMPKSILKQSHNLLTGLGTPSKAPLLFDDDWANQLQRTISPKKQDRHALRETQDELFQKQDTNIPNFGRSTNNAIFTRVGLMESLFGETDSMKESMTRRAGIGIEYPYPKRPKTSNDLDELSANEQQWHSCNKPRFSESGTLVYGSKGNKSLEGGLFSTVEEPIVLANGNIRFTKLPTFADPAPATLTIQKKQTEIKLRDGVPHAKIKTTPAPLDFDELARAVNLDSTSGIQEQNAWQLLSILFDEAYDDPKITSDQQKDRYRKEKLSEFWESIVYQDAVNHANQAATSEEQAIAYLSGHNVPDACQALLRGMDLRLATMVAQIGGDEDVRQDMMSQIEEWRRLDVLSEMAESVRALYELVSGNCAQSTGKQLDGRENKAKTFSIAQEFGLDWRRAFGLRLWYGTMADEPIEIAIAQFGDALRDGFELVNPTPWFVDQELDMGWNDPQPENREDILWGILKLYATSRLQYPANVEDVLAPENVSGHPLNARLSFQMFQLFKSRYNDQLEEGERKVGIPTQREAEEGLNQSLMSVASTMARDEQSDNPLDEMGDNLTLTYATSLNTPEHWTTAIWVCMHLTSSAMREHRIRSLLAQYVHTFSTDESDATYKHIIEELQVPEEWVHAAAALQAKVHGDDLRQTMHLIKAGDLVEAHEVLCRSVGPDSIISRDYDALRELLGAFVPLAGGQEPVEGWKMGGKIYSDYIHLLELTSHQSSSRVDKELNKEINGVLSNLQDSLEKVARDRMGSCGLEERVALTEIAGVVGDLIAKNKHAERSRVLKLPLTEDLWLRHSSALSLDYYRAVMATAK